MQHGYDNKSMGIYEKIGDNIRKKREELGLSQSQLADMVGLGNQHQTISRWESGKPFYLYRIDDLCEALQCDYGYLMGLYDDSILEYSDIRHATNLTEGAAKCIASIKDNDEYMNFISSLIESFSGLIINKIILIKAINAELKKAESEDIIRTDLEDARELYRWQINREINKLIDWHIDDGHIIDKAEAERIDVRNKITLDFDLDKLLSSDNPYYKRKRQMK